MIDELLHQHADHGRRRVRRRHDRHQFVAGLVPAAHLLEEPRQRQALPRRERLLLPEFLDHVDGSRPAGWLRAVHEERDFELGVFAGERAVGQHVLLDQRERLFKIAVRAAVGEDLSELAPRPDLGRTGTRCVI